MLLTPVPIDPQALYDNFFLTRLGYSLEMIARARKSGRLRHAGRGMRALYLGAWLLEWWEKEASEKGGANERD